MIIQENMDKSGEADDKYKLMLRRNDDSINSNNNSFFDKNSF